MAAVAAVAGSGLETPLWLVWWFPGGAPGRALVWPSSMHRLDASWDASPFVHWWLRYCGDLERCSWCSGAARALHYDWCRGNASNFALGVYKAQKKAVVPLSLVGRVLRRHS